MKKILIAIALTAGYCGVNAQTTQVNVCGVKHDKVCRLTANKKVSCYKTKFAENYKVCKGDNGYFICCETPNETNSTFTYAPVRRKAQQREVNYDYSYASNNTTSQSKPEIDMTVPQSQSYVMTSSTSYEGYYPRKGTIKVCYTGDNVAASNRAPYEGCPSPQFDGPEANNRRNVNVSNPVDLPPLSGRAHE